MHIVRRDTAGAFCLAIVLLFVAPAAAQDSRAEVIETEQKAKAADLKPREPSKAERWVTAGRREFLEEPSGFYPFFASVYSGGGFTLGAGYRHFYGDRSHVDVKGLYSVKSYKLIELSTDSWGHAGGRLDLHGRVGWRDATQVAYYGLGIDTPDDRANFRMKQTYVGGDIDLRPGGFSVFGAGLSYEDYSLEEGQGTFPSIEEVFTPITAPGLGVSPTYVHLYGSAGIDWRKPSAGYARSGGLYQISYHNYADQDETYSFDRVDGDIVQHIPILRETWIVSLRGRVQTTLDDADQVPYFLMPSLGSGSTLRAYPSWRFRDRHSWLASGEFRWIPNRYVMDMALFYDIGKVASEWDGLDFNGLKDNVGIGIRFHTPLATPLRVELAHGDEGFHLVFAGDAAF